MLLSKHLEMSSCLVFNLLHCFSFLLSVHFSSLLSVSLVAAFCPCMFIALTQDQKETESDWKSKKSEGLREDADRRDSGRMALWTKENEGALLNSESDETESDGATSETQQ